MNKNGRWAATTGTVTATNGSFKLDDDCWQQRIDEAMAVINSDGFRELHVGPNDVLVVQVRTVDIPAQFVHKFLLKVKKDLHSVWVRVGLAERVLYEAGESSGFSVIHVSGPGKSRSASPPIIG